MDSKIMKTKVLNVLLVLTLLVFDFAYTMKMHTARKRHGQFIGRGRNSNWNHRNRFRRYPRELQREDQLNTHSTLTARQQATAAVMAEKLEKLLVPEMEKEIETIGNLVYNAILEDQRFAEQKQSQKKSEHKIKDSNFGSEAKTKVGLKSRN